MHFEQECVCGNLKYSTQKNNKNTTRYWLSEKETSRIQARGS